MGGAGGTAARLPAHQAAARWCRPPARLLLDSYYRAQRPGLHQRVHLPGELFLGDIVNLTKITFYFLPNVFVFFLPAPPLRNCTLFFKVF